MEDVSKYQCYTASFLEEVIKGQKFLFFFFFNRAEGTLQHLGNGLQCLLCLPPTAVRKSSSETPDSLTPGTEVFSFHGEVSSRDPVCDNRKVEDNLIRPNLPPPHQDQTNEVIQPRCICNFDICFKSFLGRVRRASLQEDDSRLNIGKLRLEEEQMGMCVDSKEWTRQKEKETVFP